MILMPSFFPKWVTQKVLLILVGTFIATLFLGWRFFIAADLKKLAGFSERMQTEKSRAEEFGQMIEIEKSLNKYKTILAKTNDASSILSEANRLASESGLVFESIVPQSSENRQENDSYGKYLLHIEARGTYHQFGDFASRIESYPGLIKFYSIVVESRNVTEESGLAMTMDLAAYYAK